MRKKSLLLLKLSMVALLAITLGQTTNAQVQQRLCEKYEAIQSDNGLYTVNNNIWGSDAAQCIDYYGGAGFVVESWLNNDNDVASYPFLGAGCHWGNCSNEDYGLPIPANEICSAPVHYKVNSYRPSGKYNVMIEGWLLPQGRTTDDGYQNGCEILIGLDYVGGMGPCGPSYGYFGDYEMFQCDWAGWSFVQFVKRGTSEANIDFKDFLQKSIDMGWCGADWNLHNMQAGFEIMNGGTGLATEEFTFSVTRGNCGGGGCDDAQANQVDTRIEAEAFCDAGDVQTGDCNGSTYVGWIDDLDYMTYKLDVPTAGEYTVTYNVASMSGGTIQFEAQGGTPSYGTVAAPVTGDWCNFTTVSHTVNLEAGIQNLAIAAPQGGWNIDWFEVSGGGNPCTVVTVPAKIEAEDYCDAHDIDTESNGGVTNVGWINAGSWMKYAVNVPSSGTYTVEYNVASFSGEGSFNLEANGSIVGSKTMPNTGGWQNWETISHDVQLNGGEQDIYIRATAAGWNIDWFEIKPAGSGYSLNLTTSGNGSVSKSPDMASYPAGTSVTLSANPGSGDSFLGWGGDLSGMANPVTIVMDGNKSVSAAFSNNGGGDCTSITLPFRFEGTGSHCWETADEFDIINSWSLDKLTINGVDYTNAWANGGFPAKIDGKYKIEFESTIAWGTFDATGKKSAGDDFMINELTIYPNPAQDQLFVEVDELETTASLVVVDMTGKQLINQPVYDSQMIIDISTLESGIYMIKVNNSQKRFIKQ